MSRHRLSSAARSLPTGKFRLPPCCFFIFFPPFFSAETSKHKKDAPRPRPDRGCGASLCYYRSQGRHSAAVCSRSPGRRGLPRLQKLLRQRSVQSLCPFAGKHRRLLFVLGSEHSLIISQAAGLEHRPFRAPKRVTRGAVPKAEKAVSAQHVLFEVLPGLYVQLAHGFRDVGLDGVCRDIQVFRDLWVVQPRAASMAMANSVVVRSSATSCPVTGL